MLVLASELNFCEKDLRGDSFAETGGVPPIVPRTLIISRPPYSTLIIPLTISSLPVASVGVHVHFP